MENMNKPMNKIEKLIAEFCSEGVEFKELGEVIVLEYGKPLKESERSEGNFPVLGSNGRIGCHSSYLIEGPCIIIGRKGSAGAVVWEEKNCYPIDTTFFVKNQNDQILLKYLFHKFQTLNLTIDKQDGGVPGLNRNNVYKIQIPIPPLAIQQEIVKILDTFTTLEAELEAELEARKKQYEYYREELLTFGDDVEWKTLGDICNNVSSGGTPLSTRSDYYGGDIPWLRTQEVRFVNIYETEIKITEKGLKNSSAKWIPANCVIVAISGATAARSAINKIPLTTNQHCCNLETDPRIADYRYVFHWVSCQYEKLKAFGQGARADLNSGIIKNFPIPIPPLAEQERIVAILDKFDALVNDISAGLPAELNARRKQYEYYRDKLLTFKRKV